VRAVQPPSAYRREGETYLIEVKLNDTRQLFNSLDPAPFIERDLDDEAAAYVEDAVREIGTGRSMRLRFHLPAEQATGAVAHSIPEAVHAYFTYRARHAATQFRHVLRDGLVSLGIGLTFLFACLTLREVLLAAAELGAAAVLGEGLLIMGWVAMWRPIELFLYDWWPVRRRRRVLSCLAGIPVDVHAYDATGATGS